MVEFAARESEATRGSMQTTVYFLRFMSGSVAFLISGLVFNGRQYGGDFTWTLSFPAMMGIVSIMSFFTIPFAIFCLKEEDVSESSRDATEFPLKGIWKLLQRRSIFQIAAFFFLQGLFSSFGCSPQGIVKREWARVTPLTDSIFGVLGGCIFSASLLVAKKCFLNTNWRTVLWATSVIVICIDVVPTFFTIYDVYRNQFLWVGVPIIENIPAGVNFIVASFVAVEVAEVGFESTTFALLTTVKSLTGPFATSISKQVNGMFDAFADDIESDTMHVRHQVMGCFVLMYVMHLLGNVWLFMLPRQKNEAQKLRGNEKLYPVAGAIFVIVFTFSLTWSILTNVLSVIESTSCLKIAGGSGCN